MKNIFGVVFASLFLIASCGGESSSGSNTESRDGTGTGTGDTDTGDTDTGDTDTDDTDTGDTDTGDTNTGGSDSSIRLGILMGLTGPIQPLASQMALSAEAAITEVSNSEKLMSGTSVSAFRADTGCISASVATRAMENLTVVERVSGVIGGNCSGTTFAALTNVAVPNNMIMISPSATAPRFSDLADNGLFFRTAPSDSRQGVVLSETVLDRGIREVALTFVNDDYGRTFAESFESSFTAAGGSVTISALHENGKADYDLEVGALNAAGGEALLVVGYADQGGRGIVRTALQTGPFSTFIFSDGMIGDTLIDEFGGILNGSFGLMPGADNSEGQRRFLEVASEFDGSTPFAAESYDAAALLLLSIQAAGSEDPEIYKRKVLDVANAPGERIYPGELSRALGLIASGVEIDYVGASGVELNENGESTGNFRELEVSDAALLTVQYR